MPTIISNAQSRHKDSYAPASDIGLLLRSNGEEKVQVITETQDVVLAGFEPPTYDPVPSSAGAGVLTANKWVSYRYVYASTERYPFVTSTSTGGGGLLAPRGNPGDAVAFHIGSSSSQQIDVRVAYTTREDISDVWLYRTLFYDTQAEAETAAEAGLLFYINDATNNTAGGFATIRDNVLAPVEQIELDNYIAPTFAYCVYDGSYFWGFGNPTFSALCDFDNSGGRGIVTLTAGDTWYDGRDGQILSLDAVTTEGFDGRGSYYFEWLTSTTATVYADSTDAFVEFPSTGEGATVTIQGPATTLYRSKLHNPFAWGYTTAIGESLLPIEFGERVGGGYGTGIAVVPNEELLICSTRYPSRIYSFNLGLSGDDGFFATRRTVSDVYGFTSHFSIFAARQGNSNVLRGLDQENSEIIQTDGIRAWPVLQQVSPILRGLTNNRARQELAHGCYDPRTQTNCIWITTSESASLVNYGIFEDTKTGAVTVKDEHDLLSSGVISDTSTNGKITLGGTQSGLFGIILEPGVYADWSPTETSLVYGVVASASSNSFIRAGAEDFTPVEDGLLGNWCMFADATNREMEWARISLASDSGLTFDVFTGSSANQFANIPLPGSKFYVGLIQCELQKYFDFDIPSTAKKYIEQWLTMENASGTTVQYYRERDIEPFKILSPTQTTYSGAGGSGQDTWFIKEIPSQQSATWGVNIINRNYEQFKFYNSTLKPNLNP